MLAQEAQGLLYELVVFAPIGAASGCDKLVARVVFGAASGCDKLVARVVCATKTHLTQELLDEPSQGVF